MIKDEKLDIYTNIKNEVRKNILDNKLIQNNDRIVVAVSGGPDSMCLLTILNDLKEIFAREYEISYELIVAHVNHMIREESDSEKEYVESVCNKLRLPFYYLKEDVEALAKKEKLSVEACGRKVRYDFFDKIKKKTKATKIATAHNLDDNVETILLNIIRGCGLKGLIGMNFWHNDIIRPLLTIEKKYILEYNIYQNLKPCFDNTNNENIYLRNKIRNILIPLIEKEYNSNFSNNIIRMKDVLTNEENFLKEYTNNILSECIITKCKDKIVFKSRILIDCHIAISFRCIREIINLKVGNLNEISNVHISDIYKLLKNNIKGKKYIIGNKFTFEILGKDKAVIY